MRTRSFLTPPAREGKGVSHMGSPSRVHLVGETRSGVCVALRGRSRHVGPGHGFPDRGSGLGASGERPSGQAAGSWPRRAVRQWAWDPTRLSSRRCCPPGPSLTKGVPRRGKGPGLPPPLSSGPRGRAQPPWEGPGPPLGLGLGAGVGSPQEPRRYRVPRLLRLNALLRPTHAHTLPILRGYRAAGWGAWGGGGRICGGGSALGRRASRPPGADPVARCGQGGCATAAA